jgi:hypothetical protein
LGRASLNQEAERMRRVAVVLFMALGLSASPLLARHHDYNRGGYYSDKAYREDAKRFAKEQRQREKAFRKAEKEREKAYRKMMRHPDRYGYGTSSRYGYSPYGYSNNGAYSRGYYDRYGRFHRY